MCTRPMLILSVVCISIICLTRTCEGKPASIEDIDAQPETDFFYKRYGERLYKRNIQTVNMALWEFCYKVRYQHPRCQRAASTRSTPAIMFIDHRK